jgi:hypothetical protein
MPGLSGFDLHARLVKQRINIPVIFVSGYADIPMSVKAHRHHTASAHMMAFLTLIYTRLQGHRPRTEKGDRRRIISEITRNRPARKPAGVNRWIKAQEFFRFRTMPRDELRRAAESPGAACVQSRGEPQAVQTAPPRFFQLKSPGENVPVERNHPKIDDRQGRSHSARVSSSSQRILVRA